MDKRKYNQIRDCMRQLIKGTPFENKVFFVGGCRDIEIKDIDMTVNLPYGASAWWNDSRNRTTHGHGDGTETGRCHKGNIQESTVPYLYYSLHYPSFINIDDNTALSWCKVVFDMNHGG